jgi:crossover junction endodeoxyribonuclease RuvC
VTAESRGGERVSLTIGIDPGSHVTGYGLVERRGLDIVYVASGVIKAPRSAAMSERLLRIKQGLDEVIGRYHPTVLAVEDVFMAKNPKSTLALGEVRGVVLLVAAQAGLAVHEYSPREVKSSVVGAGGAHKRQVAAMVTRILRFDHEPETEDESDAVAVAFCHAVRQTTYREVPR